MKLFRACQSEGMHVSRVADYAETPEQTAELDFRAWDECPTEICDWLAIDPGATVAQLAEYGVIIPVLWGFIELPD